MSRADDLLRLSLQTQYTTAQIVNMLRQLDVTPLADLILISLARKQRPENVKIVSNL